QDGGAHQHHQGLSHPRVKDRAGHHAHLAPQAQVRGVAAHDPTVQTTSAAGPASVMDSASNCECALPSTVTARSAAGSGGLRTILARRSPLPGPPPLAPPPPALAPPPPALAPPISKRSVPASTRRRE